MRGEFWPDQGMIVIPQVSLNWIVDRPNGCQQRGVQSTSQVCRRENGGMNGRSKAKILRALNPKPYILSTFILEPFYLT